MKRPITIKFKKGQNEPDIFDASGERVEGIHSLTIKCYPDQPAIVIMEVWANIEGEIENDNALKLEK